jgi:hypothetical protein
MLYSVLIPWLTLREVIVEVEIVSHPRFLADDRLIYSFSHLQKSPFFDSTAGCSKVSWAESVVLPLWSTTPSELLARAQKLQVII